jgi:hypothetical protein
MNVHKNARLTPFGRERIVRQVESGQTPEGVGLTPRVGRAARPAPEAPAGKASVR